MHMIVNIGLLSVMQGDCEQHYHRDLLFCTRQQCGQGAPCLSQACCAGLTSCDNGCGGAAFLLVLL